jgi:hypothetical protein
MVKIHNIRHTGLRHVAKKPEPEPQSGISVGTLSTGQVDTDNSFKIKEGSVFSGGSLSNNNVRIRNPNVIHPKIKNRNKETLVRTIF